MADTISELLVRINAEDNASAVLSNISGNVNNMSGTVNNAINAVNDAGNTVSRNKNKFESAGKSIKNFGEGIESVAKPFQIAAAGAVAGGIAVSKMAMDYETAFTGVKKTIDGTPEQMNKVNTEIRQMSKEIPVSAKELANIAQIGGQLGVGANDITKFTETMAAMGVATNLSGEEGAAAMARLLNVTGESVDNVDRAGSAIVALGNTTATSEAEIASMAVRMGKYGNTVGMNTAQVLGYSAALSSMGIEAQMGGSAIGRTWLDIQKAVSSGGDALNAYAKYAGKSAEEFKQQWSTDPSGAFNGLIKGLSASEDLTLAMAELGIENTQDQQAVMALANNYDLLTKCMDLSGTAYKENTALMKEANTAYGTTANQIQLAKNAVADAAINWGNVLLTEIKSGAEWVSGLADKFGSLDDNQKRAVISGAKTAVVIGATGKAVAAGVKGVGNFVEGIANIKKGVDTVKSLSSAGGVFSKIASGATAAGSALAPLGIAIAGVSAAVLVGKIAYDGYYKATYKFADGMKEQSEAAQSAYDQWKELNDLQWEFKDLSDKVNGGKLEGDDLENAKQRLEEIKQIFAEKYNLDLDSGDIDDAIEKAKQLSEIDVFNTKNQLRNDMDKQRSAYDNAIEQLPVLKQQLNEATAAQTQYKDTKLEIAKAQDSFKSGAMDEATYLEKVQTAMKGVLGEGTEYAKWLQTSKTAAATLGKSLADTIGDSGMGTLDGMLKGLNIDDLTRKVNDLQGAVDGYKEAAKTLADIDLSQMGDALKSGGDITPYMQEIGKLAKDGLVSATEYASKIALLKEGFSSLGEAANAGKLDNVSKQITDISHAWGTLPADKSIKIDVQGNTSVIDDVSQKVKEIKTKDNISIKVDAKGNVSILDKAGNKMKELQGMGVAELQVNAEGNIDVLDQAGDKIAEIDGKTGQVMIVAQDNTGAGVSSAQGNIDSVKREPVFITAQDNTGAGVSSAQGNINSVQREPVSITAQNGTGPGVAEAKEALKSVKDKTVTITVNTVLGERKTGFGLAKGTQNFPGGLAMVNDQKGVADPRELIIDRGQAFIPQGKDVILPLSKGAKVYTAAQTKRIMRNMGIPRYAEGKDNSDAFKTAQEDWTHYTRTHAVTVTDELEKWTELSAQFTGNIKDAEDCAEQLYSATRDVRNELNELSEEYIKERSFLNDWDSWGDSAVDAFNRVHEREAEYVASAKITQREADKYLKGLGEDLYDFRVENSEKWLDKQIKYSSMLVDDQMAAIDRMEAYTADYYSRGIISYSKYIEGMESIDALRVEKLSDAYSKAENRTERYKQLGFAKGDNLVNTLGRQLKNLEDAFQAGAFKGDEESYWDKRASLISEQNSAIYDEFQTAMDKQQTLYDTWDMWDAVGGKTGWLEAYARQLQDLRDREIISEEEFENKMLNIYVEHYNAQSEALDEALQAQSDYIDSVNDRYDQLINKKEDAFDWMQLERDIDEERTTKNIYAGAVTQRGKDVYKDSVERLEELEHEKEIKLLQEEQTRAVSALKADYELMVQYEKPLLNSLNASCIDVKGIANDLKNNAAGNQALLQQLIDLVKNLNVGNTATYGDTNYNISGVDSGLLSAFMRRGAASISGF